MHVQAAFVSPEAMAAVVMVAAKGAVAAARARAAAVRAAAARAMAVAAMGEPMGAATATVAAGALAVRVGAMAVQSCPPAGSAPRLGSGSCASAVTLCAATTHSA